jgi:hypothetical protein
MPGPAETGGGLGRSVLAATVVSVVAAFASAVGVGPTAGVTGVIGAAVQGVVTVAIVTGDATEEAAAGGSTTSFCGSACSA